MDFAKIEQKILAFWQKSKVFDKLRQKNQGKQAWSFLDGPITANNPMGVHHAWGRTYKDMFQRYKAMRGFDERFQNGFDCQGLWVEVEVEKELGFKNKKDIEQYGIEKFVEKCKARVRKYSKIQTKQSIRLGQWMDWPNSYYTMSDENNYAIWAFLKQCQQKGLLYKGRDSVPWCPRCGTAISQHEILGEEYKEVSHKTVFVKLSVKGEKKTFFLVWTTTPWTLPGNVALAVHPELQYAKVKDKEGSVFILLKDKAELIEGGQIIETIRGEALQGLEYEGPFDKMSAVKKALGKYKHRVILWDEVSQEEGTGIVHTAPGCGQEDFQLSKELELPVIDLSDDESNYRKGFDDLTGKFVGSPEARDWIFKELEKKKLFKIEDYSHRYPTCWRCKTELIFRVVDEWYIAMEPLRKPLMETIKKIKWVPSFGLERELDWLKNMSDWLISKKRYWGLALPIYECSKCGNFEVIGSKQELKEKAVEGWQEFEGHSPHRPWLDNVKIKCSKCEQVISRILDVGNPWLDAGIVPFSTIKYFENKNFWQKWFPIDFICESFPGQFKNWFYSLLVMSQVLEGTNPFKTVLGFATVVDEKGEEMHKSKGNAIWFDEAVEKIGADVMRWMYLKQNPTYNLRFGYKIAQETKRKLLTLWNCYGFFQTYGQKPQERGEVANILDKWILSKLNGLVEKTTKSLDKFDPARASTAIEDFFINDLSLWYIRRSRKRFGTQAQDQEAGQVLYEVLVCLVKLIAPMMPFLAEELFQKLRQVDMPESVHLCDWPKIAEGVVGRELEETMAQVRNIAAKALAKRAELGIRIRQPLASLKVKGKSLGKEFADLIKEEVNVKKVSFDSKIEEEIVLDAKLTLKLKEEGYLREIVRHIQDLRKRAGLTPKDRVVIYYTADKALAKIFKGKKVLEETRADKAEVSSQEQASFDKDRQVKIDESQLWLAIKKINYV